tara:strand:+ start:73 stop:282 length:210 start_codon:yes stop_codon:yes gene_type:complete
LNILRWKYLIPGTKETQAIAQAAALSYYKWTLYGDMNYLQGNFLQDSIRLVQVVNTKLQLDLDDDFSYA